MLLVDRHVPGPDLALGETDPVGRLRAGKDHLPNPQLHSGVDDVVRGQCIDTEGLVVGSDEDRRDRREMHDGVVPGNTGTRLQFVKTRVRRESIEDLPGDGQIDAQVRDPRITERHNVAVDDPVALVDEIPDRMPTRLPAPTGEEHSHLRERTHRLTAAEALQVHTARSRCRGLRSALRPSVTAATVVGQPFTVASPCGRRGDTCGPVPWRSWMRQPPLLPSRHATWH